MYGSTENSRQSDVAQGSETAFKSVAISNPWLVVIALCVNSSFNAYLCMNYSTLHEAAAEAFDIPASDVAGFYSMYLFSVMLGLCPVMLVGERFERFALHSSVVATVAAAWLRWWCLHSGNLAYEWSMVSQALVGYGACAISVLPGQISEQRFPKNQRALTTSVMLMANYSGWLLGATLPILVTVEGSVESFKTLLLMQCVYSLFVYAAYVLLYKELPEDEAVRDCMTDEQHMNVKGFQIDGFVQVFKVMRDQPQFAFQLVAHSLHGSLGFVVPSAIFFITHELGFSHLFDVVSNVAFIGTGVLGGVALGAYATEAAIYPLILKICYALAPPSLVGLSIVAHWHTSQSLWVPIVMTVLMAVAGFASLGFTGVAFEDVAQFEGVKAGHGLAIGYTIMLSFATPLNGYCSNAQGFVTLACISSITSLAFFSCYRPYSSDALDEKLPCPM